MSTESELSPPRNQQELYTDVAVLKAQMGDVRRIQWWILTTTGGVFVTLLTGMALLILSGGVG